jgi:hypothetical protein
VASVLVLFISVFTLVISTISLSALDPNPSEDDGGKWGFVCCGSACPGGEDVCHGDGTYKCCK